MRNKCRDRNIKMLQYTVHYVEHLVHAYPADVFVLETRQRNPRANLGFNG